MHQGKLFIILLLIMIPSYNNCNTLHYECSCSHSMHRNIPIMFQILLPVSCILDLHNTICDTIFHNNYIQSSHHHPRLTFYKQNKFWPQHLPLKMRTDQNDIRKRLYPSTYGRILILYKKLKLTTSTLKTNIFTGSTRIHVLITLFNIF